MPRHSIIMPCYNTERFVEAAINSCLCQTDKDLEVIVVDDESTDGSMKIVERLIKKDSRVKLLHQKNQGPAAARNAGIKVSTGRYISFLDADDLMAPDKLAVQGKLLDTDLGLGMVLCNAKVIDENDTVVQEFHIEADRFDGHPRLQEIVFCQGLWPPSIIMCRREYLEKIGGFFVHPQTRICEDWELVVRLDRAGATYLFIPDRLILYRRVGGSLSNNQSKVELARRWILEKLMREDPYESACALCYVQDVLGKTRSALYAERQISAGSKDLLKKTVELFSCGRGKVVVIWGAGSGGQRVLALLNANGSNVSAFVDSNPAKAGQIVGGLPIISPQSFINKPVDQRPFVIIASTYASVIESQLRAASWNQEDFYIAEFELVSTLETALLPSGGNC